MIYITKKEIDKGIEYCMEVFRDGCSTWKYEIAISGNIDDTRIEDIAKVKLFNEFIDYAGGTDLMYEILNLIPVYTENNND